MACRSSYCEYFKGCGKVNGYFKVGSYGATFFAGLFAMWLWHNASINQIEAKDAKEKTVVVAGQLNTAIIDGKQSGENSGKYIDALKSANTENDALRKRLSDGSVRLRLCVAESKTAGIQSANSRAFKDEAETNLARYQEDALRLSARGEDVDAWIDSAHKWINREKP